MIDIIDPLVKLNNNKGILQLANWLRMFNTTSKAAAEVLELAVRAAEEQLNKSKSVKIQFKVGLHGRNAVDWQDVDFALLRQAKIGMLKIMSNIGLPTIARLVREFPDMGYIARLYDSNFQSGFFDQHRHPAPLHYASVMYEQIKPLRQLGIIKLEIHNEPNHPAQYEGWGITDQDADNFNSWFVQVYDYLKDKDPTLQLGFPGLAVPHRDLEWVQRCSKAVDKADWLGVHCYWQNPSWGDRNHLSDDWGLRFKAYHNQFPDKVIHITEAGNSNLQSGIPLDEIAMAQELVDWYTELRKCPYIGSASPFLMSSPDSIWSQQGFTWREESGRMKEVVRVIGSMGR